ncbi:MAG: efflux transporter outer membrane subunit [Verrucomicrobia bacterium]|nr:efflux transporter outer membrane subunit [Verrucomicrobiota bacterium]
MRISFHFLFTAFLGLCGCASVPDHDLAQVSSSISLKNVAETALAGQDFEVGEWPSDKWWESFNDPQLNELIEIALKDSPNLKQAEAKVQFAEQMAKKQRSSLFPKLDMNYDEQWQYFSKNGFVRSFYPVTPGINVPATVNQIDLTLNFSYEFDFWGKNRKRFQAALGEMRTSAAEKAQAELVLTTFIAQTYFQLQANLAAMSILKDRLKERSDLYELSLSRLVWGIDPDFPVLDSEKNVYLVEQLLIAMEREIAFNQNQIKMLIGQGPDSPDLLLPLSASFDQPFALPLDLSIDLLARRPDLQAQIWKVESAAKEIGVAKADFYPNVNLSAFAGLESLAFNDLFKWSSHMGGLEPALHLPIFTGGRLRANLRSKVASYNEAVFAYNDLLLHAAKDVADQLVLLRTKFQELDIQLSTLDVAVDQYRLKQLQYEKGISNYLNVLDMEEEVLNQRLSTVNLRRDYLLAVLKVIKAFGGGYEAGAQKELAGLTPINHSDDQAVRS